MKNKYLTVILKILKLRKSDLNRPRIYMYFMKVNGSVYLFSDSKENKRKA